MRMRLLLIILTMLNLISCAKQEDPKTYVDPELHFLVEEFEIEANERGVNPNFYGITIALADLDASEPSRYTDNGYQKTILINREYFEFRKDIALIYEVKAVLYHELGHAILGREDKNTLATDRFDIYGPRPDPRPSSLMHSNIGLTGNINPVTSRWDSYLDELFSVAPN